MAIDRTWRCTRLKVGSASLVFHWEVRRSSILTASGLSAA